VLDSNKHLQIREEEVAAKLIDGEAIIINLANGVYYSMDRTGAFIWELVQGAHTIKNVIKTVTARYDVPFDRAEADVQCLLEELLKENLVRLAVHSEPAAGNGSLTAAEKLPYEVPKLNIYRDMGDLLALDPPTPGLGDLTWKEGGEDWPSR
jgi:hypothetical protein